MMEKAQANIDIVQTRAKLLCSRIVIQYEIGEGACVWWPLWVKMATLNASSTLKIQKKKVLWNLSWGQIKDGYYECYSRLKKTKREREKESDYECYSTLNKEKKVFWNFSWGQIEDRHYVPYIEKNKKIK